MSVFLATSGFKLKKNVTSLLFVIFSRFFLPKCRTFHVVLEKGHGAGKKGMALEKKGMALEKRAWRGAMLKLARGNTKRWRTTKKI